MTGIFKQPVAERVRLRRHNLDGDRQADLSVHGGPSKAAYAYPAEHYQYWSRELPEMPLPWGAFGENLTTEGLQEEGLNVGDRFRIGTAEVMVTVPRLPCYKLGIRFGRDDMVKRFLDAGRSGFYVAVLCEGEVGADDSIQRTHREPNSVTVPDIVRLYVSERNNRELLERALQVEALPEDWRGYFQQQLDRIT